MTPMPVRPLILLCVTLCGLLLLPPLIGQRSQAAQLVNDRFLTSPFNHRVWSEVLMENVTAEGDVDFIRLRATPKRLNDYLDQLAAVSPDSTPDLFPSWQDRLAYWLNAHNALALRLALNAYPAKNLKLAKEFWTEKRYRLGGTLWNLEGIESRLVQEFSEWPQFAWAVSDMTVDTPPLLPEAYHAERLLKQMERQRERGLLATYQFQWAPDGCAVLYLPARFMRFGPMFLEYLENSQGLTQPTLGLYFYPQLPPATPWHIQPERCARWVDAAVETRELRESQEKTS
jgi:hypothetical protein